MSEGFVGTSAYSKGPSRTLGGMAFVCMHGGFAIGLGELFP